MANDPSKKEKKAVCSAIKRNPYEVYVSIGKGGKVFPVPLRFSSRKRARAYADACQARLGQNTVIRKKLL
jgi:hypothetical protein